MLKKKPEQDIYFACDCVIDSNDVAFYPHYWLERLEINDMICLADE